MDIKKERNYDLEQYVHDITRGAELTDPYRCNIVVDVLSSGTDCDVNFRTGNEAFYHFIVSILNYLHKDTYCFDIRYNMMKDKEESQLDFQYELIAYVFKLLEDNGCEEVDEILYNYSD